MLLHKFRPSPFSHSIFYILHAASQFPSLLPVKATVFLVMLFTVARVGKTSTFVLEKEANCAPEIQFFLSQIFFFSHVISNNSNLYFRTG